ncbi:CBS domain-containing protein [Actinopolymorpha singaporensis]|uniref:CBS domain-containing protein n=1 Tax=Actinopolymorpha singaporensis TaxID=117157 RepID=A0A1H1PIL3_9ACTN|nr:CBS domain-containing protein [Actinopolymorpha singaporensis]SDS11092.1 CBS domain-containing protein [Actinopolymorpha singaporensis]
MTTARDIMTPGVDCAHVDDTIADAARKMAELDTGALPICGADDRLKGMLTDRDIVVKVLAAGLDPKETRVEQFQQGDKQTVTIGADDDVDELLATMTEHQVRRLPVIDGHRLVGIVSQADVARSLPKPEVGDLVAALSVDY